jgi:cyanate lyase
MTVTMATSIGTITLADQLNRLRERVPLSEQDVARATGADAATVQAWLHREAAPMGAHANRLTELIAVIDEMAGTFKPGSLPAWLNDAVPALDGRVPADVISAGGYEQVMNLALGLSAGAFT